MAISLSPSVVPKAGVWRRTRHKEQRNGMPNAGGNPKAARRGADWIVESKYHPETEQLWGGPCAGPVPGSD
jgi:hypothetical protein